MYKIGDKVAHPMHGAGIIENITEQKIGGVKREYYVLKLSTNSMLVMVPVASSDEIGLRPVIDDATADKVIAAISTLEPDEENNWNKRYRENMVYLKSGDLMQVAKVIKSLVLREREKGLSTSEKKMLSSAKQILISEIVLAKSYSYEEIENIIDSKIK